jgi:hypothetical protein
MSMKSKYPELDKIANEITIEVVKLINDKALKVESKMPYRAQYVLEQIIKNLENLV